MHAVRAIDARIPALMDIGLPFVTHGRATGMEDTYSWVDVNNRRAFLRATTFLLDLGHQRVGLVNGSENMAFAARRRTGYSDALAAHGIRHDPELMASGEMTEQAGFTAASAMLNLPAAPTAFLAASMLTGMGVRRAIEARGLRMGRDVSVIIFDDELSYLRNGDDVPIFTATRSSVRDAGRIAAQMLLDLIADPTSAPHHRLLEADLILGQSTGPVPKPA